MTHRVLIVEDDPLIAMDLEAIAVEAGAAATVCSSVREALERLEAGEFELALLDVDVADGQTFGVARRLRQRQVPLCFVSAVRRVDIPADIADAPLVPKPYVVAELKERIRAAA
jgi:DNA-binding response OmpR family regulator